MRENDLRNRRAFVIIAISVFVLASLGYFLANKPIRSFFVERAQAQALAGALDEGRWRDLVRTEGGKRAYEEFAQAVAQLPALDQHTAVHLFGSALYDEVGLAGLVVCDQRFFGGCFHQFLGRALAEHGYSIMPQLVNACTSEAVPRSLFCTHGVGHGLVAATGYERTDLAKALIGCDSFPVKFRISCYQGAFMEYEERTVLGPNAGIIPFKGNWYEPCDSVEGMQRSVCLFHQSQWWWDILAQRGSTPEEIYPTIGALCAEAGSDASIGICFSGMGNTFGFRLPTEQAAQACLVSFPDQERTLLCVASLARREVLGGDPSLKACSYLADTQRAECETRAGDMTAVTGGFLQLSI